MRVSNTIRILTIAVFFASANIFLNSVFSKSEKQVKPNYSPIFRILIDFQMQNNDESNNSISNKKYVQE